MARGGRCCEFITHGYQIGEGQPLPHVLNGQACPLGAGYTRRARCAADHGAGVGLEQGVDELAIRAPIDADGAAPVIKLECAGRPPSPMGELDRFWQGDPRRMTSWAASGRRCGPMGGRGRDPNGRH